MSDINFNLERLVNSCSKYIDAKTRMLYLDVLTVIVSLVLIGLLFKDLISFAKMIF